jgi:predicted ATPase
MTGETAIGHTREDLMTDPHQVNLIITNAICDAHKDHQENRMNPEEAKQIAKCIIEALSDAGFEIVPAGKPNGQAELVR